MKKLLTIAVLLMSMVGCNSFRTSTLTRHANDSVSVQPTSRKLKGLPVKLKVPSHLHVTVYEQQVILANSESATKAASDASTAATAAVEAQKAVIKGLDTAVTTADALIETLRQNRTKIEELLREAEAETPVVQAKVTGFEKALEENSTATAAAEISRLNALKAQTKKGEEENKLKVLESQQKVAKDNATIKYTLLSFNPAQYVVETDLQYTDKVFLVDFKRPAGGIFNLTEASFDHEQYFSNVQAEVEERTLADVGSALETLTDPLSALRTGNPGNQNTAIATSAGTSESDANQTIDFQNSVVATQRFDISEAGWEGRLQKFVNHYIQNQAVVQNAVEYLTPDEVTVGVPVGDYYLPHGSE